MDSKIEIKEFLEFVYSFYKTMRDHQVVLVYEGIVTHQVIKSIYFNGNKYGKLKWKLLPH